MINQICPPNTAFIQFASNKRAEYSEEITQLFNDVLKRDSEIQEEPNEQAINEENNKYEEILIRENLVGFIIWSKESAQDTLAIPHLVIINSKINLVSKSIDALVYKFFKYAEAKEVDQVCFNIDVDNSDFISFLESSYSNSAIAKEDSISLKSTQIMKRELYYAVPKKNLRLSHSSHRHNTECRDPKMPDDSIERPKIKSDSKINSRVTYNTRAATALRSIRETSVPRERGETPARQRPSSINIEEKERSQSSLRNKRAYSVDKRSIQNDPKCKSVDTDKNKAPRR